MTDPTDPMADPIAMHRIPGLFRRWELAQLIAAGEAYRIEDAGTTEDGAPLLAVYRAVRDEDGDRP